MNSEVVKRGWLGIDTCPLCRKALDKHDMVEHWGLEHGGLDRAIDKCQGWILLALYSCLPNRISLTDLFFSLPFILLYTPRRRRRAHR